MLRHGQLVVLALAAVLAAQAEEDGEGRSVVLAPGSGVYIKNGDPRLSRPPLSSLLQRGLAL